MASVGSCELRVLVDPCLGGPSNMARDETLLLGNESGDSPPTLRLYQWSVPTISLGYFQRHASLEEFSETLRSLAVVRRLTGGGAILHDRELTYSLALPNQHSALQRGPDSLYELAHEAVTRCLADLSIAATTAGTSDDSGPRKGPFFCFARRHRFDLLVGDAKIVGSAQRRTRSAILQHGSIILDNRFSEQPTAKTAIPFSSGIEHLIGSLPRQFAMRMGLRSESGTWTSDEVARSRTLEAKYASAEWTQRA